MSLADLVQSQRELQLSLEAHARYINSLVKQEGLHHKYPLLATWPGANQQAESTSMPFSAGCSSAPLPKIESISSLPEAACSKSVGAETTAQFGGEEALQGMEWQDGLIPPQEAAQGVQEAEGLRESTELPQAVSEVIKSDQDER